MKGKNYANRKPESERPLNDFYPTPSCMVRALLENDFFEEFLDADVYDPCCGKGAICNVLRNYGYKNFVEKDLIYGQDFLKKEIPERPIYDVLIMNPPFDRMIAFDRPETEDGKVECGMMVTGWFVWNRNYEGLPKINVLDMQKYILRKGKTK